MENEILENLLNNLDFKKEQLNEFSEWELITIQKNCYRIINLIDKCFGKAESIHGPKTESFDNL